MSWERVKGSIIVAYDCVPGIAVPVPITMFERFTTRNGDEISGDARTVITGDFRPADE